MKDTERARTAMQRMLERVPYAVFTLDHEWQFTLVNDKAERILRGENCSSLHKQNLWTACPHIAGTQLDRQLRHAMSSAAGITFEGYLVSADAWYEASAEPSEEGLTVFFKDVTAKRRADDELRESEQRYRFVFEQGLTGNVVSSPDGKIFACNQAFVAAFGFSSIEHALSSESLALWREPHKRDQMLEVLRKSGRFGPSEVQTRRSDGSPSVSMLAAVARFEEGKLSELHACILDISEQKKLEAQFRQAQKMEAVGQLAGGMAHDFNNLLTVIKAYVQLALGDLAEEAPLRADMLVIGNAADRAAELTRQLLAFSRQQVLLPQRVSLRVIVTDIEPMIHALLGPEITIVSDIDQPVSDVEADRSQLDQVLMNLTVNARDAMPAGGTISFTIGEAIVTAMNASAHEGVAPGVYVTRAVGDTGTGMSAETASQIFEPFFTTKGPGKGTGLGLSTVYGIVKQSGGHVKVTSAIGVGTTFTIHLPVASSLAGSIRTPGDESVVPGVRNGQTVLIVDDDASVRKAIVRSLLHAGYTVLQAASGDTAIETAIAHNTSIDLLLSDVEMPGMQGPDLAERMRELLPNLPIVFMSGYADAQGPYRPPAAVPEYRFVAKPFTTDELTTAVQSALAG